jgi:hypothetical protein
MSWFEEFDYKSIISSISLLLLMTSLVVFIIYINKLNSDSQYTTVTNTVSSEIPINMVNKLQNMITFYKPIDTIPIDREKVLNDIIQRCQNYLQTNKTSTNYHALLLLAKQGDPLPSNLIDNLFEEYTKNATALKSNEDFTIIVLIRLLYLLPQNSPQYIDLKNRLIKTWENTDFWIKPKETQQCFWSENHMICYLSSSYLWAQIGGKVQPIDKTEIEKILLTYLNVKMKYGFYEAFSQVYNMYTFSAILNIYDFTLENSELKILAKNCCDKLVQQFLSVTNSKGVVYCTQARAYAIYKTDVSGKNFNKFLHLYTGLNNETNISPVGAFICTSKYLPDPNIFAQSYSSNYENVISLSHSPQKFVKIYADLSRIDRTLFQWSAGCYFDKYQVTDTINLLDSYDLWNHSHFKLESFSKYINYVPMALITSGSGKVDAFTEGSMLCNMNYHIYHNEDIILTSFENYNYGKLGAQQFPWVANVGGVPVFTQSGKIVAVGNLNEAIGNSHLPNITQSGPLMLIVYQPYDTLKALASKAGLDLNVYLYWPSKEFDEEVIKDNWHFGRKDNNYIGVFSSNPLLFDQESNQMYNNNTVRQAWVVVVGTSTLYNSFNEFQILVRNGTKTNFDLVEISSPGITNLFIPTYEFQCSASLGPYNVHINW